MQEMPTMAATAYGTASSTYANLASLNQATAGSTFFTNQIQSDRQTSRSMISALMPTLTEENTPMAAQTKRRLVQVFIADTNENVPLDQMVLYKGEQKLTDATDQELFFEVPINDLLKAHNEKRTTFIDKKVKERIEHLEPAKIRDLKMVVVTIAEF